MSKVLFYYTIIIFLEANYQCFLIKKFLKNSYYLFFAMFLAD